MAKLNMTAEELAGRIIVALDYANSDAAERLIEQLKGIPCYLKVGMQLFYAAGPDFVTKLKNQGYKVFLDVKMHDIPNTVKGGAESVTRLGVDMFNVHAAGGKMMMEYALEGVDKAMTGLGLSLRKPLVIGVTQLTSTSKTVLNEEIGITGSVEDSVVRYAKLTKEAGLDGVVASPLEVNLIKSACNSSFITVTPGIRPAGSDMGDQTRVLTPQQAFIEGTDYVVIGRPITAAEEPRKALESIIESVLSE